MNILTLDIEEWFHLLETDYSRNESDWDHFEIRIHHNMERIFRILEDTHSRGTFFCLGWIARKYPEVIRQISDLGYEVGCHSASHHLVHQLSPTAFREDTISAVKRLEDILGKKVTAYRAPGFSITEATPWAFEILAEAGITHDSSVFPAPRAHGGYPGFTSHHPCLISIDPLFHSSLNSSFLIPHSSLIKEFPITTTKLLGKDIVFGGGGYFRLFSYPLIKRWTRQQQYMLAYIHPRDLDAGQPMLPGLSPFRKFKSYYGLKGAEQKLRKWLTNFQFTDIATFDKQYNWDNAQVINL